METKAQHVVIAGAGVIGLALALELADRGWRVTVLERGRAMEQSSWAAAGMLAVEDPENAPELLPLSRLSRALYPAFLARVEALSGLRVPLRTAYTLQAVHGAGEPWEALPELRSEAYRFSQLEEASLDPRDLCAALPRAVRAAGVTLREQTPVEHVGPGAITLTDGTTLAADLCVIASGAWSGQIAHGGSSLLPVAPRKGQMIEVTLDQTSAGGAGLPVVIRTPELYLVPRGDGRVVIGATVEHAGFDRAVDEAAGDALWSRAAALWPPVRRGRITQRWTGLRPGFHQGIADALPVLGTLGNGVWAATGHFRNGILLAPGTARVLAEQIAGETTSVDIAAFSPERFALVAARIQG